jgi:hypothetical protein
VKGNSSMIESDKGNGGLSQNSVDISTLAEKSISKTTERHLGKPPLAHKDSVNTTESNTSNGNAGART